MIATPELNGLNRPEDISPPLRDAVTIPLAIDGRHSMHDGYAIYVGRSAFTQGGPSLQRVSKAIARAVAEHLKTLPPFNEDGKFITPREARPSCPKCHTNANVSHDPAEWICSGCNSAWTEGRPPEPTPRCPECDSNEHVTLEPPEDNDGDRPMEWVCSECDFAWIKEE